MAYRIRLEGQKIELEYGSMSSVVKIMFKIDLWTFDSCVCLCQRQKNHTRKRDKVIDIHQLCTISPNSHLGVTPAVKDRFTTGRRNSNRQFNSSTCYMASFEFARFVSKDLLSQTCHRRANVIGYPTVVYRRIVAVYRHSTAAPDSRCRTIRRLTTITWKPAIKRHYYII